MTRTPPRKGSRARACALGIALALLAPTGCRREAPAPAARNAVLICLDTVRADSFELALAQQAPPRAHWDRAVSLVNAQSASPWTLPAVGSVLTGLRPERHGMGSFATPIANLDRQFPRALDAATPTLVERLSAQGFETVALFAHPWLRSAGIWRGFETFTYVPGFESRLQIAEAAERWLASRDRSRRFLLYVHLMEAHQHPFLKQPGREARIATLSPAEQEAFLAAAPGGVCADADAPLCRQYLAYAAAVAMLRDAVSRVLDALARHGELERSVVLLFADHGEEFLDHAELEAEQALDPRGSYGQGHGHSLFAELLRVPFLVWHPALTPGRNEAPASLVDVAPTLLDYLGIPLPPGDGQSLRPALEGGAFDPERPLYASGLAFGPPRQAVVRGRWKGIAGDGIRPLYYDLAQDPRELAPRDDPGGFAELLAAYRAKPPGGAGQPLALDAESVRALQAIGYLEQAQGE